MSQDHQHQMTDLSQHWIRAELDADIAALNVLSTDDFTLVGPFGFVLTKSQWLDRYRTGDLITSALDFDDVTARAYPDTVVAIGRLTQRAQHRGTRADGVFRITQIAVTTERQLRLAGLHYSPIAPSS